MTRLLIANDFLEDLAGTADARRKRTGWWAQRLVWFAREGDVIVLAAQPENAYLDYVLSHLRVDASTVEVVVPEPGRFGSGVLSADRLLSAPFIETLRSVLASRRLREIVALHPDAMVAALARALGDVQLLAGWGFIEQGGGVLANSKAAFRAIAGGLGVPIPAGATLRDRTRAPAVVWPLLEEGGTVILKHDLRAGGRGNEVLSLVPGVEPVGASRTVLLSDRVSLSAYFDDRWDWLTDGGRSPLVVERYHSGSSAVFAEYRLGDAGAEFCGQGEMVSAPMAKAEIIPAPGLQGSRLQQMLVGGERLAGAIHGIGYRGILSADALLTPQDEVLFTECNCRITGSTHIYEVVGKQLVGDDYAHQRVLLERDGVGAASFADAVRVLAELGLAYSRETRTGVVLVMAFNPSDSTIRYCVVERTLEAALEMENVLEKTFAANQIQRQPAATRIEEKP